MSGITAVYVAFAVVLAALFGYSLLLMRRQRDIEVEIEDLRDDMRRKVDSAGTKQVR